MSRIICRAALLAVLLLSLSALVAVLLPAAQPAAPQMTTAVPAHAHAAFQGRHGIGGIRTFGFPVKRSNLDGYADALYWPHWRVEMAQGRLAEIRRAGFDFVRINIDPGPLFEATGSALAKHLEHIEFAVNTSLEAGLDAVLDLHVSESDPKWSASSVTGGFDSPEFQRYLDIMRAISRLAKSYDPRHVAIELFNEPPKPCHWTGRPDWPEQLGHIYAEARVVVPHHTLIVSGACFASIEGLQLLNASRFDANTMFAVHFYEPYLFTHQGYWSGDSFLQYIAPLPYPVLPDQRPEAFARIEERFDAAPLGMIERITAKRRLNAYFAEAPGAQLIVTRFDEIRAWAERNGVDASRIIIGEFGVMKDIYGYRGASSADRNRWLADVRMTAERDGFAWSAWALTNTMGIVTGSTDGPLDPGVLRALGLNDRDPTVQSGQTGATK